MRRIYNKHNAQNFLINIMNRISSKHYAQNSQISIIHKISNNNYAYNFIVSIMCIIISTGYVQVHKEKTFWNLVNSHRNQILFTICRLIWNQTDVHLAPNQSKNGEYNLISVWINKIPKKFPCVLNAIL